MREPPALSALEIAAGIPLAPARPRLRCIPAECEAAEPFAAFRAVVLEALRRPPCLVSFSGGRDSSAVLAVAAAAAREEGLPLPIPATTRFRSAGGSDEAEWQERTIQHLGLEDWVRVDVGDELDCVGPIAGKLLRRHGVLWPPNAHFHEPLTAAASGGSLLTGVGGDEVFSVSRWARAAAVLARQTRPTPRDLARIAVALGPTAFRARVLGRAGPPDLPWLTSQARQRAWKALLGEAAREPLRWSQRFAWLRGLRYVEVGLASLSAIASDADVRISHPFFDRSFLVALAGLPPARRFEKRSEGMMKLFGSVLPADVVQRPGKAEFGAALTAAPSRELARAWDGEHVDPALVDVEALRSRWTRGIVDGTETLLQHVWLCADGARSAGDDRLDRLHRAPE